MKSKSRIKAESAGRRAEWAAALFFILKGYRVLARRYKTPSGEIDLIARRGGLVVFVEVKQRRDMEDAISAVTTKARRRIERAAELFMARHEPLAQSEWRYDIIAISGMRLHHIPGAWRFGE